MSSTNAHIAGGGKAIDSHERNKNRPEEAEHFDLKDQPGENGDEDHAETD